jgi:hypothetical protein
MAVERECAVEAGAVKVRFALNGQGQADRVEYVLPAAARDVQVVGDGLDVERRGQRVIARPMRATFRFDVTYRL